MPLRNSICSELATVLVVRKKDDHNKKTSHLILKMSMNEAFIWLTEKCLMARIFFRIFTENNPVMGYIKTFFIPEAKGLRRPPISGWKIRHPMWTS